MQYEFYPLGDQAVLIEFGKEISADVYKGVQHLVSTLDTMQPDWLIEYIPAYTTLTVVYNPIAFLKKHFASHLPYHIICDEIKTFLSVDMNVPTVEKRTIEIPVCYGGKFGPDLSFVAESNELTEEEVIHIHSNGKYLVYMIGFAPGFPYIGGMPSEIATPRRSSPRLKIPARSVGIAGSQTGIYPIETPGGWQLIGSTPLQLFNIHHHPPTLLQAGDHVRFKPISYEEYRYLEDQ